MAINVHIMHVTTQRLNTTFEALHIGLGYAESMSAMAKLLVAPLTHKQYATAFGLELKIKFFVEKIYPSG